MSAEQNTPGPRPMPAPITRALSELREAEFKSGMHRTQEKSAEAERWARILRDAIRAAIAKAQGQTK